MRYSPALGFVCNPISGGKQWLGSNACAVRKGTKTMKKTIRNEGFTLVELLVVIAIIALLASALFPAINGAMNQARATALKNKGRGVWVAINETNMENEPLGQDAVWPGVLMGDDASDDSPIKSKSAANDYFTYLLSDGESTEKITGDTNLRVVTDLKPEAIIAQGIKVANVGDAVKAENCAWHVCAVDDSTPDGMPFMVTKNVDTGDSLKQQGDDKKKRLSLKADTDPFKGARGVWVARGGGIFDASARNMTYYTVMGEGTNEVKVFKCDKGSGNN